jgi:uncharacterized protein involved in outer membrane biogenesis
MNAFLILKVTFFFVCALLVLLVTTTAVFLNVESVQRHTLTTLLSTASELDVQIGEVVELRLLPDAMIVVKDLRLVSTGGSELFNARQLGLELDLRSILSGQSWIIADLKVDSARVDLSQLKDADADDWFPEMSGGQETFELPLQINRWQFTDSQIVYRDDDQNIVLNVRDFEGETVREHTQISIVGDLNGLPFDVTGLGEVAKSRAEGSLKWGELSANFTTDQTLTSSVPSQHFKISMTAPSSKPLLSLLGAPEIRDGDFSLQVNVDRSMVDADIVVDVDLGEFKFDLSSHVDDIVGLDDFEFSYQVIGPSLEEAGALFDFLDFPSLPFSMRGSVNRQNTRVDINRSVLNIGDGEFVVQGSLPNFPSIDGWQLDLEGDEFGLDMLRPFSRGCDLPRDSYRWYGSFRTSERGEESINLLLENAQRRLQIEGSIGQGPGYEGTRINVDSEGVQLSRLSGCLGLDGLTDEPTQTSAVLAKQGQDWILSPLTVIADSLTVSMSLTMDRLLEPDAVQLSVNLVIDDLGKVFDPSAASRFEAVSGSSLSIEAKIEGTTSDLHLSHSSFLFNGQRGTISGRLGDISRLQQLKLFFESSGDDIWQRYRGTGAGRLPYKLSGRVGSVSAGWRISDVQLKAGGADLTFNGLVSNQDNFFGSFLDLELTGEQLSELLPPALAKDTLEQAVSLELFSSYEEGGIDVGKFNLAIGTSTLDASAFIDLPQDYRGTRGQLSLKGSSTAEFLALLGYEPDFLDRAFSMDAQLEAVDSQMSMQQLKISFGESDLTGRVSIDWLDRPFFDVDLQSNYLYAPYFLPDLETIAENVPYESSGDMAHYEDELTEEELSERLIEDRKLSTSWMNLFEGEFTLNAEEVFFSANTTVEIDIDVNLKDGTLTSRQLDWRGDSFQGHADLEIDKQDIGARYLLDISSSRLPLFALFSAGDDPDGDASYRARVASSGDSIIDLLGNMDGKLLYKGNGGEIHSSQLDTLFGDFFSQLASRLVGQRNRFVQVGCNAGAMTIENGELQVIPGAVLRTDNVDIFVRGKVNLVEESLDLVLNSRSRRGIGFSAMKTVSPRSRIVGTFANPRFIFDATGAVASGTAALATGGLTILASGLRDRLLARRSNPCDVVYEEALKDNVFGYAELTVP